MKEYLPTLYPRALDSGSAANQSLIGPKAPVYVAGLDLGVLPIGDWSISIILSINSVPLNPVKAFGTFLLLFLLSIKLNALYKVCKIKVDFPLPDTPVTQVNVPIGIFRLTFFKLFPEAPLISINRPFFANLLFFGIAINFFPDR